MDYNYSMHQDYTVSFSDRLKIKIWEKITPFFPKVRDTLAEVSAARDFASRELGLPDNRWSTRISFPYQEALGT